MSKKPTIVGTEPIAESKLFKLETVSLQFANGEARVYERISMQRPGAVLIVPWYSEHELIFIKEYAVGTDSYSLGFPKGLIDPEETPEHACQRELQEEIGFKPQQLTAIKEIAAAPGFTSSMIHVFEATGLEPSRLEGDEPEPLEQEIIHLDQLDTVLKRDDFIEARSMAALLLILYRRKLL